MKIVHFILHLHLIEESGQDFLLQLNSCALSLII